MVVKLEAGGPREDAGHETTSQVKHASIRGEQMVPGSSSSEVQLISDFVVKPAGFSDLIGSQTLSLPVLTR